MRRPPRGALTASVPDPLDRRDHDPPPDDLPLGRPTHNSIGKTGNNSKVIEDVGRPDGTRNV